jgi:hypothetical protein
VNGFLSLNLVLEIQTDTVRQVYANFFKIPNPFIKKGIQIDMAII